jgi:hypothetical protein
LNPFILFSRNEIKKTIHKEESYETIGDIKKYF